VGLAVPASHAASARQLVEIVDFGPASVSPNGRLVAFRTEQASVERNTYDTVWYVQPINGSLPPRRLGEGGAPLRDNGGVSLREPAVWSPDGQWIFYRAEFEGRVAVWRAAVDGRRTAPVTHDAGNVRSFRLAADGASLTYSVGATREQVVDAELAEYDRGVHIDRTVGLGDTLFRSGYHEGRLATQRLVHNELERAPLLAQSPDRWMTIDLASGALTSGHPPEKPPASSDVPQVLGAVLHAESDTDGSRLAVLTRSAEAAGAGSATLAMVSNRGRSVVRCSDPVCTEARITAMVWRPDSDEIVFTVADSADRQGHALFRWNVVSGGTQRIVQTTDEIGGGGRWSAGACAAGPEALVCVTTEASRPPRLERIDLETGDRRVLFDPNGALAHEMQSTRPVEHLVWRDPAGQQFSGQFFRADASGAGPPPLFVVYYRCSGFLRGGVGDEWPLATLARAGIAALCINAAPLPDDAVLRFEQGRAAVESAVALLAARGAIDATRVGMGGLSFGAEVSMWTAMQSSLLTAISVSTPVMSPNLQLTYSLWEDTHLSRVQRFWQLGAVDETPDQWRAISPAYAPERISVPVLMQMSEQEYRTSLDYAVPMIRARQADLYVFPHELHQKFQPRHKLAVYERNLDWFRFWLLGAQDTDPSKNGQYERWRQMRHVHVAQSDDCADDC